LGDLRDVVAGTHKREERLIAETGYEPAKPN
jgi:hypothetical protein